jgi:hypothetical protein
MSAHVSRRVWVQSVAVGTTVTRSRLDALRARRVGDPDLEADALDEGVRTLLDRAENAAYRVDPRPRRISNWWRGTLYEAAFLNLHAAQAQIALLYDTDEIRAELPEALARVEEALQKDDPRRADAQRVATSTDPPDPHEVSKIIEVGYSAADQTHTRVRNFRNVVVMAAGVLTVFLIAFTAYISTHPSSVPLCFRNATVAPAVSGTSAATTSPTTAVQVICPTSQSTLGQGGGPAGRDVLVVGLVGLMGAALASAVSLRNMRGTSTPYDVPIALAFLKLPTGALSAIAALIAIRGDFVPGLSALDSQEQILAYALVFGYAQQLLTGLVDRQGQNILSGVPSKDAGASRPSTVLAKGLPAAAPATGGSTDSTDSTEADDATAMPDEDLDPSDVPDPEPRDTPDPTILDDSGTVEELPDDDVEDVDPNADDDADNDADNDADPNAAVSPDAGVSASMNGSGQPSVDLPSSNPVGAAT